MELFLLNAHCCAILVVHNKKHRDDDGDRVEYFLPDNNQHIFDQISIHNLDDRSNNHVSNALAILFLINAKLVST